MIEPNDIILHLQSFLPAFTNLFSNILTATATVSGTTVTVISIAHGLSVSETITVGGGEFENAISAVVDNGDGTLRFTTSEDHDLTAPKNFGDEKNLTLDGIGSPWDGSHKIVMIPNRRTFEIEFPVGETVPPSIATAILVEDRAAGIIGLQIVATVLDVDTFTFIVSGVPNFPTGIIRNLSVIFSIRIAGAENIERAEAFYTAQTSGDAWLFLIMTDAFASKDRDSLNDGVATFTKQNIGKQTILQNFSVVVFLATDAGDPAGQVAQNKFYGEIFRALVSTMYGFFFDDPDTAEKYVTVTDGHGPGIETTAYTTHVYDWQIPTVITFENGFLLEPDVAFRDIVSTWFNNSDEEAVMDLNIDLDDEPL